MGALIAVLIVSIVAGSFLQLSSTLARRQGHATATKQAFYIAEAGLAEAYTGLAQARTGNIGSMQEPAVYGNGLFWVEAEERDGGLVELECTAMCGSGRATLGMAARRVEQSLASLGLFSATPLSLAEQSFVDGYDSRDGSYEEQVARGANAGLGVFGSNGDVVADGPDTTIDGDVVFGPQASFTGNGGANVTGRTGPRVDDAALPDVRAPSVPLAPAIDHAAPVPLVLPAGTNGFEALRVRNGAEVVVMGPGTLRLGTLQAEAGAQLSFDTSDGALGVYVDDEVDLAPKAHVACSGEDPTQLILQVAAESTGPEAPVSLQAEGSFFGTVYAPRAAVELGAGFELFGAVLAERLELAPGVRLHYDRALASGEGGVALPTLVSWRVVDIPDAVAAGGGDPFRLLGLDPDALPAPSEAHEDQWLEITYGDTSGAQQSYQGWESGFAWGGVGQVLTASRDGESFAGESAPPPPPPPPSAAMNAINDPTISSSKLRDMLKSASPLTDAEMTAAIDRTPEMNTSDLKDVLKTNSPSLSDEVLTAAIDRARAMHTSDLKSVLEDNSPGLSDPVLLAAIQRGPLQSSDLKSVLEKNSPLAPAVLQAAINRNPPMNSGDLNSVLSKQ